MPLLLDRLPEDAWAATLVDRVRKEADIVTISLPKLGALISMHNLTKRGAL